MDEELAWCVVNVGMQPSEFWALTVRQLYAIKQAWNRANR